MGILGYFSEKLFIHERFVKRREAALLGFIAAKVS